MANANTNTTTTLPVQSVTFYNRTLLARLLPNLEYAKYGQKRPIPKGEGSKVNFRRFNSFPAATTPLTEGVTPDGRALSIATVEATVAQYGDYVEVSDKLDVVGIDPVLTEAAEVLGEQGGLTVDTIVRNVVCAGTNVQYANGKASRGAITATDVLNSKEVAKAVRTLRRNNAKPIDGKHFVGIIDPDGAFDIMQDPLWQDVSKYANDAKGIMDGEIGRLLGVRFVETTNAPTIDGTVKIHQSMIIGKGAYGVVDIENGVKPEMIIKARGSAGTSDPLDQRATAGWKTMFTAVRLDELAMVRVESAATV